MMNVSHTGVHHFLEESARRFPYKVALIHDDVRLSYDAINNYANQLARWLMGRGIAGDRVAILLENSPEYVIAYYGVMKAGMVAVPLGTDGTAAGIGRILAALEPRVVISNRHFSEILGQVDLGGVGVAALLMKDPAAGSPAGSLTVDSWQEVVSADRCQNPALPLDEESLSSIIYTSGSTGMPRGVMLSHRNVVSNVVAICSYLKLMPNDIQMAVLPFFYVMGKSLLNTHFAVGGTVVINNKFAYPAAVVNQMIEERVTGFSGVPSTYAWLLHRSPLEKYRDRLITLRYCSQAGGHLSRRIKEDLRKVLPEHTEIYIMYGATEASARLTYLEPERYLDKIDSIGKGIPGVTLKLLNNQGAEVLPGETGELVCSGPNIMMGYWRDPDSTAKVLTADGYHTGDLGYRDNEGYVYLVGRKDDMLKVGGHRVNTQEIEDALMETGLVIEVLVAGFPDPLLGNRLVAFLSPNSPELTGREILSRCSAKLPRYKTPSFIKIVSPLPKLANGKIDKKKCMELFSPEDVESGDLKVQ